MKNRSFIAAALALSLAAAAPVAAQGTGIAAGAAVKDTSGGTVGSVVRVDGDHLIVRTDKHEARLPASSFTPVEGGLLFGMTRDQLNAAVERTKAQSEAKIAPGAAVFGKAGASVGTVEAVDDTSVTVKLSSGASVRLPRNAVGAGENGVRISLSAAELQAATAGNKALDGGGS